MICNIILKTIFFYIFIIICFRLMGKREIAELSISDLTISILIAELAAISIENINDPIYYSILPMVVLVILEIISALIELKFNSFKRVIDGKPSVIINNNKLNLKEMMHQRYSINDLLQSLRTNHIDNIKDVKYAVLETNGRLSIFKNNSSYPLPLIIDGKIDYETLKNIRKTTKWLKDRLEIYNVELSNVLYAFLKNNIIYIVKNK